MSEAIASVIRVVPVPTPELSESRTGRTSHVQLARTPNRAGQAGFSLIELLFVISIMLIITAMAVPRVIQMNSLYALNGGVANITGAIEKTRLRAISQGLPYTIAFTAATNTYTVSYCPTCTSTSTTETYVATVPPSTGIPFAPPTGATLSSDFTLYVRPGGALESTSGTVSCPTVTTVTLTRSGVTKTITIGCYGRITAA